MHKVVREMEIGVEVAVECGVGMGTDIDLAVLNFGDKQRMIEAAAVAEKDYVAGNEVFALHDYAARVCFGAEKKIAKKLHARPTR